MVQYLAVPSCARNVRLDFNMIFPQKVHFEASEVTHVLPEVLTEWF